MGRKEPSFESYFANRTVVEAPIFIPTYEEFQKEREEIKVENKKMLSAGLEYEVTIFIRT